MGKATWTVEQYEKVRDLYSIMTCLQIGQLLGKTEQIIKGAAIRMGLTRTGTDYVRFPDAVRPCELLLVKALYRDTPAYKILEYLPGRTEVAIIRIAHYHKIRRTAEEAKLVGKFNRGMYEKGAVSHNKGKKGWKAGGRSEETRFKKGDPARNELKNHTIVRRIDSRGRPYIMVKVDGVGMRYLSRYIWEQTNGPIPKEMLICHIDRNPENCKLENLVLRTRSENAAEQRGKRGDSAPRSRKVSLSALEKRERRDGINEAAKVAKERLKLEIAKDRAVRKQEVADAKLASKLVRKAEPKPPRVSRAVSMEIKAARAGAKAAQKAVAAMERKQKDEAHRAEKSASLKAKRQKAVKDEEFDMQKAAILLARKEQARTKERAKAKRFIEGDNKKVDTRKGHEYRATHLRFEIDRKTILLCKPENEAEFLKKYPNAKKLI